MKFIFLPVLLFFAQFSFGQLEFYIENQLVDQSVQQNVESQGSSSIDSYLQIKNLSTDTISIVARQCVVLDSPNWHLNYLGFFPETDVFGGTLVDGNSVSEPCWEVPWTGMYIVDAAPGERAVYRSSYSVLGSGCETVRYYILADAGATILDSIDINYCSTLSLSENDLKFEVFPNPAADFVQITMTSLPSAEYYFVNAIGETVKTGNINDFEGVVNVDDLKDGYYFIRLKTDDGVYCRKLFVSN